MVKVICALYIESELKEWAKQKGYILSHMLTEAIKQEQNAHMPREELEQIKKAELNKIDKSREDIIKDLNKMRDQQKEATEGETKLILEARTRKKLNEERNKWINADRNIYNLSYSQLKAEGKFKKKSELQRMAIINKRFKKNYKTMHGVNP